MDDHLAPLACGFWSPRPVRRYRRSIRTPRSGMLARTGRRLLCRCYYCDTCVNEQAADAAMPSLHFATTILPRSGHRHRKRSPRCPACSRATATRLRIRTGVDLAPFAVNSFASVMRSLDMREIMGVTSRLQRLTAPCNELPNSEANGHLDHRQIKGND